MAIKGKPGVLPENLSPTSDAIRGQIVETAPGDIEAPATIIQTVSGARAIHFQYRQEHLARIELYAEIEGLIAGNPPYSPQDLAEHKLSHLSNFNTLDARALYEKAALAYWNLLNEAQYIAKFEIQGDYPELIDITDTLSRHFNDVVRDWSSFNVVFNTAVGQLVRFGISPVLWPDERDWRWRTIELSRFFVEDQAQSDIDQVTRIFVESIFTVQYLYQVYEQFKDRLDRGKLDDNRWDYNVCPWNLIELGNLLVDRANSTAKTEFNNGVIVDMMDLQRRLQNGDLTLNAIFSDDLRIVTMLSQEYSGKISHYMFDRIYDSGNFLYFVPNQYKCMDECLVIFTASPGEFTIHSNRGLGHKIFSGAQAMMQLDCSSVDMGRMAATPLFQTPATGAKDFESIRIWPGVATNIGTAEFIKNDMGGNLSQLIGLSRYILQKLQFNTANSGDDPAFPDADKGSLSAPQARMKAYKEFSVLKNNIMHFYGLFDRVIKNMVIKMLSSKKGYPGYESAKEWKDRCIADGVPEQIFSVTNENYYGLPKGWKVSATRVVGDGSTAAKILGLESLVPIAGDFGPRESREYKRQWIMATMGPEYVPAFLQDSDDPDNISGGASLAQMENAAMQGGFAPLYSADNDQKAHFVVHLALGNNLIRQIKQKQLTPLAADKAFVLLVPHMQEHWVQLQKSPFSQKYVLQMREAWKELQEYAVLNHKNAQTELAANIKKQQAQQEKTQQILSDEELKNLQVAGDERRADFKVNAQVARADKANETRGEVMREKVQSDASIGRLKTTLDARNKTIEEQQNMVASTPLDELRVDMENISGGIAQPPIT